MDVRKVIFVVLVVLLSTLVSAESHCDTDGGGVDVGSEEGASVCATRSMESENNGLEGISFWPPLINKPCISIYRGVTLIGSGFPPDDYFTFTNVNNEGRLSAGGIGSHFCSEEREDHPDEWVVAGAHRRPINLEAIKRCIDENPELFSGFDNSCPYTPPPITGGTCESNGLTINIEGVDHICSDIGNGLQWSFDEGQSCSANIGMCAGGLVCTEDEICQPGTALHCDSTEEEEILVGYSGGESICSDRFAIFGHVSAGAVSGGAECLGLYQGFILTKYTRNNLITIINLDNDRVIGSFSWPEICQQRISEYPEEWRRVNNPHIGGNTYVPKTIEEAKACLDAKDQSFDTTGYYYDVSCVEGTGIDEGDDDMVEDDDSADEETPWCEEGYGCMTDESGNGLSNGIDSCTAIESTCNSLQYDCCTFDDGGCDLENLNWVDSQDTHCNYLPSSGEDGGDCLWRAQCGDEPECTVNADCPPGAACLENSCVDSDADTDGVLDADDICPNTPGGNTLEGGEVKANGCLQDDTNNDGCVNLQDIWVIGLNPGDYDLASVRSNIDLWCTP